MSNPQGNYHLTRDRFSIFQLNVLVLHPKTLMFWFSFTIFINCISRHFLINSMYTMYPALNLNYFESHSRSIDQSCLSELRLHAGKLSPECQNDD